MRPHASSADDPSRSVVLLRAVNVGGRRVDNARLVEVVQAAGFEDVQAYQAAGNLLLDPGIATAEEVAARVEAAIDAALGFSTVAFVRDRIGLDAALAAAPFTSEDVAAATSAPQIGFLTGVPDEGTDEVVAAHASDADRLALVGRELHWLPMAGIGRAALDLDALASALGPLTIRTRGTIERLRRRL